MKPKELMIGDWVMYEGHPYQIRRIYGEDRDGNDYPAVCIGKPNSIGLIVEGNEISPIPITPEILEKNGFEKNGSYYILNECIEDGEDVIEHYEIIYHNDGFCSVQNIVTEDEISFYCPNVHKLQQAMRLCGISKEIEL